MTEQRLIMVELDALKRRQTEIAPARSAGARNGATRGLSKSHIPPSPALALVEVFADAGFMEVRLEAADFRQTTSDPEKHGIMIHFAMPRADA